MCFTIKIYIMKRIKRCNSKKGTYVCRGNVEAPAVTDRVLRSAMRNRTKAQEIKNSSSKDLPNCVTPSAECIILDDVISPDAFNQTFDFKGALTSTPENNLPLTARNYRLRSAEKSRLNNTSDVIVISDYSTPSVQIIDISDDEAKESSHDIQILSSATSSSASGVSKKIGDVTTSGFPTFENSRKRKYKWVRCDNVTIKKRKSVCSSETKSNIPGTIAQIGDNVHIENPIVLPKTGLRPIIIDGSNVAFHHSNNNYFSCKGLEICIKYFKNRGHNVTAFVPQFRVQHAKSDNPKLLDQLAKKGDVVLTPSRKVDGNHIVSYDDRYIVQTAAITGGVIVTRDNYRDLLKENPAWSETIKYRLLQFTWVKDFLIFPEDPLGRKGPSLGEFLKFG